MHVIDSLAVGGAERMLVEIANHTARDDFKVSVCVTRSDTTLASELKPEIPLYVLNRRNRFDLQGFKKLARVVREQKVNVFHVHGRSSFAFIAFASSMRLVSSPIIFHDHFGIEVDDSIPIWFRLWGKWKVSHYVGVYRRLALWAQRAGVPSHKISVIENALDLSRILNASPYNSLRQDLNIPKGTLVGVFVGGLRREKGLEILIEALSQSKYRSKIKILVVGAIQDSVYFQACREKILQRRLSEAIVFLGCRTDVPRILKSVDFAVIPSISESGPLVLIEYMAAGLPFVATRVGAISLRVEELGVPGFVPPNNPKALAESIDELVGLSSPERVSRGNIGKEVAFQHFDIHRKMPQWYEVYARVLGRNMS